MTTLIAGDSLCLCCDTSLPIVSNWRSLSLFYSPPLLCKDCNELFEPIVKDSACPLCSKRMEEKRICKDCQEWEQDVQWEGVLTHNRSLYAYTPSAQEIIYRWKYRGDAVLALIFRERLRQTYIKEFSEYVPVPVPISTERRQERGFNQSELLVDLLHAPYTVMEKIPLYCRILKDGKRQRGGMLEEPPLIRPIHERKQSKKSRIERKADRENPFRLREESKKDIQAKQIVIIDDIYTTGSTLRKAASMLLKHGAKEVCALTLFRG